MTLLLACGGGGSGATAAGTPTTMTPSIMNGPGTPPPTTNEISPPTVADPQPLPQYWIRNLPAAQTAAGGTAPGSMNYSDIIGAIRTRATDAEATVQFSDIAPRGLAGIGNEIAPNCTGMSCTADITGVATFTFSLNEIYDPSLIGDAGLEGYNVQSQAVMSDGGVSLVQGRGAARQSDGKELEFQTYAGWLDESVFGVETIKVMQNANTSTYYAGYSLGVANGTNPTGTSRAVWNGVFVGVSRASSGEVGRPFQGDVTVDIDDFSNPNVDVRVFNLGVIDVASADSGRSFNVDDMPLSKGTFESSGSTKIKGSFYGDGHEMVGGTIVDETNFIGAFGGTRRP